MWHMLCERGKDLQISFTDVEANEQAGQANWEAIYTFSGGRKVHNIIDTNFTFAETSSLPITWSINHDIRSFARKTNKLEIFT